jgi:hypothetical protein
MFEIKIIFLNFSGSLLRPGDTEGEGVLFRLTSFQRLPASANTSCQEPKV